MAKNFYYIVFVLDKLFENNNFKYSNIKLDDENIKVARYIVKK